MPKEAASFFDLSKLKNAWADFIALYETISSSRYGAQIAKTNDYNLMVEYGRTLDSMAATKRRVETALQLYTDAKQFIGFGALPLIPLAVIGGIIAVLLSAISLGDKFMKKAGIERIQQENPGMTSTQAATVYDRTHQSVFGRALDTAQIALLVGGAALLWFVFMRK